MCKSPLLALLTLVTAPLWGREWSNTTNTSHFEASFVSHDATSVTLRKDGKIVTFSVEKLHQDDRDWLRENHPLDKIIPNSGGDPVSAPPKGNAFDTLSFGDSRKEVLEKLNSSSMVDSSVTEVMLARVGLNGAYRTKETIGGLHCQLYFDWDLGNLLKEVTLRTKPLPADSYSGSLKSNWTEMIEVLTTLHGAPVNAAPYPNSDELADGAVLNSHLWRTKDGNSVLLGTGQEGKQYSVNVRMTAERIQPVVVPE